MSGIHLDTSKFPLVIATYSEVFDAAELEAHFDDIRHLVGQKRPYVMITDLRVGSVDTPAMRKRASDFQEEIREASNALCQGAAVVVASKLMRLAVKAVLAFSHTTYPQVVVEDFDGAVAWCREQMLRGPAKKGA